MVQGFQVLLTFPDSYEKFLFFEKCYLESCGIKTKRVCILGEVGREVNTAGMREKHLQKMARRS